MASLQIGEILNLYIRSPLLKKAIRVPESGVRYFLSVLRIYQPTHECMMLRYWSMKIKQ